MPKRFSQYPDASLDYKVDWTRWLSADTLLTSTWIVPAGITEVTSSNTTLTATIVLSGGTQGTTYDVINRITTAAGFADDRTIKITIGEK